MAEINQRKSSTATVSSAEREYLQRELLALTPRNDRLKRMIEAALQNIDEGVKPMTSEEIYEYLGRK